MTVLQQIIEAGLIQFGRFQRQGEDAPMQTAFDMLASYPTLLRELAKAGRQKLGEQAFDHLLCPFDALPFGVALSLETGIPLVYSRGRGEAPAHDLVGAYDIGHPAVLVADVWDEKADTLVSSARRVGLEVRAALVLLDVRRRPESLSFAALLHLPDLLDTLTASGELPYGLADAVRRWAKL